MKPDTCQRGRCRKAGATSVVVTTPIRVLGIDWGTELPTSGFTGGGIIRHRMRLCPRCRSRLERFTKATVRA